MKVLPPKFTSLLYEIQRVVIAEVEDRINRDYLILMNKDTHAYLSKHSEIIKHHSEIILHSDYFIEENGNFSNHNAMIINHLLNSKESTKNEYAFAKRLNRFFEVNANEHFYDSNSDIYFYSKHELSLSEGTYSIPSRMSDYFISELSTFSSDNNIPERIGCDISFYLDAIVMVGDVSNPIECIAERAAENHLLKVSSLINVLIHSESYDLGFMVKEIYAIAFKYSIEDVDNHFTTDIPLIPFLRNHDELISAYHLQEGDEEFEIVFITKDNICSFKFCVDHPNRRCYTQKEVLNENSTAILLGHETHISQRGIQLLEMQLYDTKPIKHITEFTANDGELKKAISERYSSDKELMQYFDLYKGSWTTHSYSLRTEFVPSTEGLSLRDRR